MKATVSSSLMPAEKNINAAKLKGDRFIPQRNSITLYNFTTLNVNSSTNIDDVESQHNNYLSILRANLTKTEALKGDSHVFSYKPKKSIRKVSNPQEPKKLKVQTKRGSRIELPGTPYKVMEAPGLQDDYYLNLLDWSPQNRIALSLNNSIFVLDIATQSMNKLYEAYECESICSLKWSPDGSKLAIGNLLGQLNIWDVEKSAEVSSLDCHTDRICTVDWKSTLLIGSRDKSISQVDERLERTLNKYRGHDDEVCKVVWSPDEKLFSSGGNDGKVCVWSPKNSVPLMRESHNDSVKSIAWSPNQYGILASAGGANDKTIKVWNSNTWEQVASHDTGSQVCSMIFSTNTNDIITSHGSPNNEINIWRAKSLRKVGTLIGHSERVLYTALSPCGNDLVSASPDETLRFWTLYANKGISSFKRKSLISTASLIR